MAGNEQFDDSIGRWLEETAPNRLPQRVLDATFDRTRRTRQDPAWRAVLGRRQMPRFVPALGGIAVVLLATVLALNIIRIPGVGVPPTNSPAATATPSTTTRPSPVSAFSTFTSTIHGISLDYPSDWEIRRATEPATEPWTDGLLPFDSPATDVIFDPALGTGLYLVLASQPYDGLSHGAWTAGVDGWLCPNPSGSGPAGRTEPAGGVDGNQVMARGCGWTQVATIETDTRGYLVGLVVMSDPARPTGEYYDYWWLRSRLDTVELRPDEAVNAP